VAPRDELAYRCWMRRRFAWLWCLAALTACETLAGLGDYGPGDDDELGTGGASTTSVGGGGMGGHGGAGGAGGAAPTCADAESWTLAFLSDAAVELPAMHFADDCSAMLVLESAQAIAGADEFISTSAVVLPTSRRLVKIDRVGQVQWTRLIDTDANNAKITAITRLPNGDWLVAGSAFGSVFYEGTQPLQGSSAGTDAFLGVIDDTGVLLDKEAINGTQSESIAALTVAAGGRVAMVGEAVNAATYQATDLDMGASNDRGGFVYAFDTVSAAPALAYTPAADGLEGGITAATWQGDRLVVGGYFQDGLWQFGSAMAMASDIDRDAYIGVISSGPTEGVAVSLVGPGLQEIHGLAVAPEQDGVYVAYKWHAGGYTFLGDTMPTAVSPEGNQVGLARVRLDDPPTLDWKWEREGVGTPLPPNNPLLSAIASTEDGETVVLATTAFEDVDTDAVLGDDVVHVGDGDALLIVLDDTGQTLGHVHIATPARERFFGVGIASDRMLLAGHFEGDFSWGIDPPASSPGPRSVFVASRRLNELD
jgi:hypothetical protein